jgi:sugar phosphate isomerase/epimerase
LRVPTRPNGGLLVDALHLARTGGVPADVLGAPAGLIRSAQLCDAPAARPESEAAIIAEARSGRLLPGEGDLPLRELLWSLSDRTMLSVEVPVTEGASPEPHAKLVFEATERLFNTVGEDRRDWSRGAG